MTAKDLGKSYINVRSPLVCHLQRNRLLNDAPAGNTQNVKVNETGDKIIEAVTV